jgi:hypothetical protein
MRLVGALTIEQSGRFHRGELTPEQAARIAAANTASDRALFEIQMDDARKARERTRRWLEGFSV